MSKMPTINLPGNFFENENVRALCMKKDGEEALVLFLQLLCHAAKQDRNGALMLFGEEPLDDAIIARMTFKTEKDVAKLMMLLQSFRLISLQENIYFIIDYGRYFKKKRTVSSAEKAPDEEPPEQYYYIEKPPMTDEAYENMRRWAALATDEK